MVLIYLANNPYRKNDIYHHGIKGQRWGVRRFQNPDGTLTAEGKRRYGGDGEGQRGEHLSGVSGGQHSIDKAKLKKAAKVAAGVAGAGLAAYGAYRAVKSGRIEEAIERHASNAQRIRDVKNAYKLSDEELLAKIGRLKNEKDLLDLTYNSISSSASPSRRILVESGRKVAGTVLTGVGLYSIKSILTSKIDPKDAANYITPKPKNK